MRATAPECSIPGELARRRKGTDRGDDGADLGDSEGGAIHSVRFVTSTPTRSPFRTPTARSARAKPSTRALRPWHNRGARRNTTPPPLARPAAISSTRHQGCD